MNKYVQEEMKKAAVAFDLTPMIDCVFLLIIFFMCCMEMSKAEYEQITLPRAYQAIDDKTAPKSRQVVNVTYTPPNPMSPHVTSNVIIRGKKYNELERLVAHLKERGVAIELGPVERTGGRNDGTSVYFRDPDGSLLEFISYG